MSEETFQEHRLVYWRALAEEKWQLAEQLEAERDNLRKALDDASTRIGELRATLEWYADPK